MLRIELWKLARVRYPKYDTSRFYDVSYWLVIDQPYITLNNNNKFSLKLDYCFTKNNYTRVTVKKHYNLYQNNTKIVPEKPKNNN